MPRRDHRDGKLTSVVFGQVLPSGTRSQASDMVGKIVRQAAETGIGDLVMT